ncbi:MAG: DUF58 domain-containing protein [Proteobacteria bacterium]|nr:DUF58 domain-containing protein [Pseudomonadota bacterium]
MKLKDYLKKLKKIEFRMRTRSHEALAGTYHSAFKGSGMAFDECKAYEEGDDIRYIDWNASARQNGVFVKQFIEERELNVCIVLDLSPSMQFGSVGMKKSEKAIEVMSTLAFSALQNNDKVCLLLFNERGMQYIPPLRGKANTVRLIVEAMKFSPKDGAKNLGKAIESLMNMLRRRSLVFIVSDFLSTGYDIQLGHLSHHHEVIPVVINDPMEFQMPDMGLTFLEDVRTHEMTFADTSQAVFVKEYRAQAEKTAENQKRLFDRFGVTHVHIQTQDDILVPIMRAFERRSAHV